jgi:membrane associated rhomboid family serine protease
MFRLTPAVKNIIIINVLMFLGSWAIESTYQIDLARKLGLFYYQSDSFMPYQFITHMFMHGSFFHLFFNMYALFVFGIVLEQTWGSKRFLIYYFITGLGAAVIHTFVNYLQLAPMIADASAFANTPTPDLMLTFIKEHISKPNQAVYDFINQWSLAPNSSDYINQAVAMVNEATIGLVNIPTVGASGAVFGVLLAFGMLFPNTQLMLLIPPVPIKAKYFVMIYGGIELFLGFSQPGSNIAHFAHIGGMIFGFFLIKLWQKDRTRFY